MQNSMSSRLFSFFHKLLFNIRSNYTVENLTLLDKNLCSWEEIKIVRLLIDQAYSM